MNPLRFPQASKAQLMLQQQLCSRRNVYPLADGEASLSISAPEGHPDLALSVYWNGHPLRLLCHSGVLADWLKPHLLDAAFSTLPEPLQLALLELEGRVLPSLVWNAIQRCPPKGAEPVLCLTLSRQDQQLNLWFDNDTSALLQQLPVRPPQQMGNIPLHLSLQWGPVSLDHSELRTLGVGDLLLLPTGHTAHHPLRGWLEGHPWARLQPFDTQLELIAMHNDLEPAPAGELPPLERLPVQVSFEVGRQTLDLQTLATLQSGSLIDLAAPLTGEVRILANQQCVAIGELVAIEERLGVRVLRLLPGGSL